MKKIQEILLWFITILITGIPLFFIPFMQDYYDTGKWIVLFIATSVSIVLLLISLLSKSSSRHFTLSPVSLGFAAITLASLISLFASSTNKIEALLAPLGPVTFISLTLLLIILPQYIYDNWVTRIRWMISTASSIVAIITIYQFFGMGRALGSHAPFLSDSLWTPTGYSLATISLFFITLPLLMHQIQHAHKEKHESSLAMATVMLFTIISGLGLLLYQFIPKIPQTILPLSDGVIILIETLKHPKYLLTGVGAENFLMAFSLGKPITFNTQVLWNIRFTSNASVFLHLATTYGLLGITGSILLLKQLCMKQTIMMHTISTYIAAASLLFFTPNITVLILIVLLLLLEHPDHNRKISLNMFNNGFVRIGSLLTLSLFLFTVHFFLIKAISAEILFYQSLQMAKANNGTKTYNLQMKAIRQNPNISKYHIIYAQTNLALAISLSSAIGQPDNTSSDDQKTKDRELVAQLIQQAIREAKLATALNSTSVLAWENLARIYNQLIGVAQGADAWTESSYVQAIALDPTNPILRLEIGSVAMKRKNYTEAIGHFQKSAALKSNYANAYYNLANAYKASGDLDNAIRALTQTEKLVDKTSSDYETVARELENLKNPQTQ